ncbi:hypothetical protein FB567DRAFT_555006 [Paraphoma chrysanthemicola]|uniref:MARVEL domain-containing protein n=1 Tax=Paraphoma chrysanthemicola TaxID=798071 RepID=A0A8K0QTQ8_9PLEO|nr:hypothetical protein FB567DRAFT_555006 [Paraphoma chrysanthemicola]
MAILDILNKPAFDSRFKLPVHVIQAIIISVVIGLSVPRLFMKNQPRTRASTIALGMGAKSLVLLAYMVLTDHVQRFRRWHSYKANVIISLLEIVFWGAVAFLVMQANLKQCSGTMCYLSWVVVGLSVVMNILEQYTAAISIREFREYRKTRDATRLSGTPSNDWRHRSDEEEMIQQPKPVEPKQARSHSHRQYPEVRSHSHNARQHSDHGRSHSSRDHHSRRHPQSSQGWQPSELDGQGRPMYGQSTYSQPAYTQPAYNQPPRYSSHQQYGRR